MISEGVYRVFFLLHGGKQLWRHPGQCAPHVPAHKGRSLLLGQTQVSNLDNGPVQIPQIAQQIVALQVKVDYPARVKVLHACCTVHTQSVQHRAVVT